MQNKSVPSAGGCGPALRRTAKRCGSPRLVSERTLKPGEVDLRLAPGGVSKRTSKVADGGRKSQGASSRRCSQPVQNQGCPGQPELFVAGSLRDLLPDAHVLAIRWFCGYGLHETLPDDSSLTRIRQRWGAKRFRRIFECTVLACLELKIAKAEILHIDASLIRADIS
jgi:hypothetical protein